jgi:hypothetical protein
VFGFVSAPRMPLASKRTDTKVCKCKLLKTFD